METPLFQCLDLYGPKEIMTLEKYDDFLKKLNLHLNEGELISNAIMSGNKKGLKETTEG